MKFTPRSQYITACNGCHGAAAGQHGCSEKAQVRASKNDDCVTCHMPHNGSIDIPHVAVTDHYIRRRPGQDTLKKEITAFLGLKCFNNDRADAITTARGFMEFYERYTQSKGLLDSALQYLGRQQAVEAGAKQNRDYIRAYFLLQDFGKVAEYGAALKPGSMNDAWAAYRIGEALYQLQKAGDALPWYKRATEVWPYSLDFQNKYGICLMSLGKTGEALKVFSFIVSENAAHVSANTNLGYIYMQQGNNTMAYNHLLAARQADPDYEQNLVNLAVWYHTNKRPDDAEKCLRHLLNKHPDNERAKAMLIDIVSGRG
ncbi:MAG: tetratricopeptide repeat protein [Taibaiella sp.]|nr:tetratricopeptide repeat protein [Taibaiella sp.]